MRYLAMFILLGLCILLGLKGSAHIDPRDGSAGLPPDQWAVSSPQTFEELGIGTAGLVRNESPYSGTIGTTTVGGTDYSPYRMVLMGSWDFPQDWTAAGIVRNESNYAYVVSSHPTDTQVASKITKIKLELGYSHAPPLPTSTGAQYSTMVADPTREIAYLGHRAQLRVDEISLVPTNNTYGVVATHDFSGEANVATGVASSAVDNQAGFAYFGAESNGTVAMLDLGDGTPTPAGVFTLPAGSGKVAAIAADPIGGYAHFMAAGSNTIYTYSAPTTDSPPALVAARPLAPDLTGSPLALAIDTESRNLFASTELQGQAGFAVARYSITTDGILVFHGMEERDTRGGDYLLYDGPRRLLYTAGPDYIYRFVVPGAQAAEAFVTAALSASRQSLSSVGLSGASIPFAAVSEEGYWAFLFSRASGGKSEFTVPWVRGDREILGRYLQQELRYDGPAIKTRLSSVRVYTHGKGGQFRIALWDRNRTESIWQSPLLYSVAGGWTTADISEGTPANLELGRDERFLISMIIDPAKPHPYPGFVNGVGSTFKSYSTQLNGFTTSHVAGEAIDGSLSWHVTHLEPVALESVRLEALSGHAINTWTNSREVAVFLDGLVGAPGTLELSESGSFTNSTVAPSSTNFTHTFAGSASTLQLYVKVENALGESVVKSDSIGYDPVPPPKPSAPTIVEAVSPDSKVEFRFSSAVDNTGGSGIHQRLVEIGTSPGTANLHSSVLSSGSSVTINVSPGTVAYCRTRLEDRAGNLSEWSNSSPPTRVNRLPIVSGLSILPPAPRTNDTIVPVFEATDGDGEQVIGIDYRWVLNSEERSTTNTLSPDLTTKYDDWTLRVRAIDANSHSGPWTDHSFQILNSLPTQPIVKLVPDTPSPDEDLIVDVQIYSTDADGDPVGYDFRWFKSTDGGLTFIEKQELRGLPQVSKNFINEGEIWEVNHIPFERNSIRGADPSRIEGKAAIDRVYIGENELPQIWPGIPLGRKSDGEVFSHVVLFWEFAEPDGEACSVDLSWTDKESSGYVPIAEGLAAEDRYFAGDVVIPSDRPAYLHVVIRDAKGAITQVFTEAIREGVMGDAVLSY